MSSSGEEEPITSEDELEEEPTTVSIRPIEIVCSEDDVKNLYEETQVCIEVHIRDKKQIVYRTINSILLHKIVREDNYGSYKRNPVTVRLFIMGFPDLFAPDIFRGCDLDPLLSLNILGNSASTERFWNFFKRLVSRFANTLAKRKLRRKPSTITILVTIELDKVLHDFLEDEDQFIEYFLQFKEYQARINPIRRSSRADGGNNKNQGVMHGSISRSKKFGDADVTDEAVCCTICFNEFKKGVNVMEFQCKHLFHTKCIVPWINKAESCYKTICDNYPELLTSNTCPTCRQNWCPSPV
ncbi:hypothetical protein MKX03_009808 [Papaver bracteatum]|nr:hypothetical protein MKX03_009808 [Papaver bracteatum]